MSNAKLVKELNRLYVKGSTGSLTDDDRSRMHEIEAILDART